MFWFLISCSDNTLVYEKVVSSENSEPNIVVYPTEIDFGSVDAGNERSGKVHILNSGHSDLTVSMIDSFCTDGISIESDSSFIIAPNEEKEIEITYSPLTRQLDMGFIEIHSDDPDTPLEDVLLVGTGNAPIISVSPEEYDYGAIGIGCEVEMSFEIKNDGNKILEITNVMLLSSSPDDLELDLNGIYNGNFNWYLDPQESLTIEATYMPNDVINDAAIIKIESNDPLNHSKSINMYGEGFVSAYHEEVFRQTYGTKADVVFVIDNSGSMNRFQSLVSNNFHDFLSIFLNQNIDFRIGILTTDSSNFSLNYIDNTTPNPISYFSNWIGVIGTSGSSTEKGLEMLHESSIYGDLSGNFIRNDANLVIIFISDEEDHSSDDYNFYYHEISNLKSDPTLIQAHAVIGPPPNGCSSSINNVNLNADFGLGYYQFVNLFHGNIYNICSQNWGTQMQNLAIDSLPMSTFELSKEAVDGSITVYVDGIIAVGWSFDSNLNAIVFNNGFIPPLGSSVEVRYGLKTECEE